MNRKRYVNLLYNKEILERRKHISSMFRSVVLTLGIISVGLGIITTIVRINKKIELTSIRTSITGLRSELNSKTKHALIANKISSKVQLIQNATSKELPYGDYYEKSLSFLPRNITDEYLKNVDFTPNKEGIFEFDLEKYEMLNDFLKDIESKNNTRSLSTYKISKININEGTPSSSIVQLKIQY